MSPPHHPSVRRRSAIGLTVAGAVLASIAFAAAPALGHGYVGGGGSTILARAADPANSGRGAIAYEPQSLEAPKGFPAQGPADGQLASAGLAIAAALDEQTSTRWHKHAVTTGQISVPWRFTAPHRTAGWRYYLTTQGWDQNAPLDRGDFELIAVIDHDGSAASTNPTHTVTIPADRSGYHVLFAVWDIADTTNAFYNVIDLDITGPGEAHPAPPATANPTPMPTSSATPTQSASPTPSTTPTPRATPAPSTTAAPTTPRAPATPTHLHTMALSAAKVSLMWFAADGAAAYAVTRDGVPLATTAATTFVDTSATPGSTHVYRVQSIGASGMVSADSAHLEVEVPGGSAATSTVWSPFGRYAVGDTVTHEGETYRCIQAHQGWGDPNWILAPSLWQRVS